MLMKTPIHSPTHLRKLALLSYTALAFALLSTHAQEPQPAQKSPANSSAEEPVVLKVTSATVRDAQNQIFGRIEELIINPDSGKIEFAFVANAINTNVIAKVTPIPWRLLTARTDKRGPFGSPGINQVLQINMERDKLLKAPSFDRRKYPDLTKKDWAHPYLSYYGEQATPDTKPDTGK